MKVLSHEERLELIFRPLLTRTLPVSYPWSGTIVTNQFARSIEDFDREAKELKAYIRRMRMAFEDGTPEPIDSNAGVLNVEAVRAAIATYTAEGYSPERIADYFDLSISHVMQIQRTLVTSPRTRDGARKGLR